MLLGAGLIVASSAIHSNLWTESCRAIPTIGNLFIAQILAGVLIAAGVIFLRRPIMAVAGIGYMSATIAGLLVSAEFGLFGFKESLGSPFAELTLNLEVAGIVAFAAALALAANASLAAGAAAARSGRGPRESPAGSRVDHRTSGMADKQQVEILLGAPGDWNAWRARNPRVRPDLKQADLTRAQLRRVDLRHADLRGAVLHQAEISEARLAGADLSGATLSESNLIAADLSRTLLVRATLVGALVLGADLRRADLGVADLRGADLRGADLRGADLSRSLFVIQTQVETATGNGQTRLPPSLVRPQHWGAAPNK
ncbi:hypothetical protein BH23ACT12_BH23ACT12_02800 [soil metagenome]